MDDWVAVGSVLSVQPPRREVRLRLEPGYARRAAESPRLRFVTPQGVVVRARVDAFEAQGDGGVAVLGAGTPRDVIAALRHASVVMTPDEAGAPDPNAPPAGAVAGAVVCFSCGARGRVEDAWPGPAGLMLRIRLGGGERVMSYCAETVRRFDPALNLLELGVAAPPGMADG